MSHDTLENSVIVSRNNSIWSEKDREEIIDPTLEIYLSKRRIITLPSEADSVTHEIDDEHDEDDLDSEDEHLPTK